jgi:hypothetical protein
MSAKRRCGWVSGRITIHDNSPIPGYRVFLRCNEGNKETSTIYTCSSRASTEPIDSSIAFDNAFKSALSFAANEGKFVDKFEFDDELNDYKIQRIR